MITMAKAPGGSAIFDARRRRAATLSGEQLHIPGAAPLTRQGWNTDHWETPWPLVHALEAEFGSFDLDPCATEENAKAPSYYTEAEDGLRLTWAPRRVFCNPPYSAVDVWIRKAIDEVASGAYVVMLLPVRTDRDWWHDLLQPHAGYIRFLRGRQRFIGPDGSTVGRPVFASCIAILGVRR